MNNFLFKPKAILFSVFFVYLFSNSIAQNIINVSEGMFQVDQALKLIVCNQELSSINDQEADTNQTFTTILLDKNYSFINAPNEIQVGKKYLIRDNTSQEYSLYFTELPIIHITTTNEIVDDPKRFARFFMVESNGNKINENIGVEFRGASSQSYPKKSFGIEFWADTLGEETVDVRLLGMRSDDDWNLQAMYNEALRFNNMVSFDLWRQIDTLYYIKKETDAVNGVKMKYAELFLNNSYRGVYGVGERIDRKQLKLKKFKDGEINGELYKGDAWSDAVTFFDAPPYDNNSEIWEGFEYEYPEVEEKVDWENLHEFISFVAHSTNEDFYTKYQPKIVTENMVNYFIFLNLIYASDNTGKNLYIAKYNKDEPYFYVPWDLDGTFGVLWNGSNHNNTNGLLTNNLYDRLLKDCSENGFVEKLKNRWTFLRKNVITNENITSLFDKYLNYLNKNAVLERESMAWKKYSYPPKQYQYQTEWLAMRINNLDAFFAQDCNGFNFNDKHAKSLYLYPNPTSGFLNVKSELSDKFYIYDINGQILKEGYVFKGNNQMNLSDFKCGMYLFKTLKTNKAFKFLVE